MDVGEWQKRLQTTFSIDGIVGKQLFDIENAEIEFGNHLASTYSGHLILLNSFFGFYIETINKTSEWIIKNGWIQENSQYPYAILFYVGVFKRFRAAEILFHSGYPLDGYSLLRDLKDRAFHLSAIINKSSTFFALNGVDDLTSISEDTMPQIIKNRKKEERRIHELMIGKESSLAVDMLEILTVWEKLFHEEVHGSKLTLSETLVGWQNGKNPVDLRPTLNENSASMYMNRATEVGWLLLRTFPYIQPVEGVFGDEWRNKYKILDDSFRVMVQGLEKLDKKIATAFILFVDTKFSYASNLYYTE